MNFLQPVGLCLLLLNLLLGSQKVAAQTSQITGSAREFAVTLQPLRDAAGEITGVAVRQTINGGPPTAGKVFGLVAPTALYGITGIADRIREFTLTDVQGTVAYTTKDEDAGRRHWLPSRPVQFPIRVNYTALVQSPLLAGSPPLGLRPGARGLTAAGEGFLLLPENAGTTTIHLQWDLRDLPAGSIGVTTFGEGSFTTEGAPERLNNCWLLAGPAQRYPAGHAGTGLSAFWLGALPFDAPAEMAWAQRAYSYMAKFYRYLGPDPTYRIFLRAAGEPPFGGTALGNSFLLVTKLKSSNEQLIARTRETFFHEMSHQWVGHLAEEDPADTWFTEGLNTYYTTMLLLRSGLGTVAEYEKRINQQARQYYESEARNWSAQQIVDAGFRQAYARELPYVRGVLYFAALDQQLRAHSHGTRTLDSVLLPLLAQRHRGLKLDRQTWKTILQTELGPAAVAEFQAIVLDGSQTVVPAPKAFGPGFTRRLVTPASPGVTGPVYQWLRVAGVSDDQARVW